jgi:hypothetical protein
VEDVRAAEQRRAGPVRSGMVRWRSTWEVQVSMVVLQGDARQRHALERVEADGALVLVPRSRLRRSENPLAKTRRKYEALVLRTF